MTKETNIKLTEGDIQLLNMPLPKSPCHDCTDAAECCGCQHQTRYRERVRPYGEAGIIEYMTALTEISDEAEKAAAIILEARTKWDKLPSEIREVMQNPYMDSISILNVPQQKRQESRKGETRPMDELEYPIFSLRDVLDALNDLDETRHDKKAILAFLSDFTGKSEDWLLENM